MDSTRGRLCGHTPCESCTITRRNLPMCMCCAARQEAYGAAKGGAGPLPPPVSRSPSVSPSEEHRAAEPAPSRPEEERSRSDSRDSDRRSARERRPAAPRPEAPPSGRTRGTGERDGQKPKGEEKNGSRVLVPQCTRQACDPHAICCDMCGRTAGKRRSQRCNERTHRGPDPDWEDDGEYDDDDEDWDDPPPKKGKGKGKKGGKGNRFKSAAKVQRDRDRWRSWGTWGGKKKKTPSWDASRFQTALRMGTAPATRRSVESRLATWDKTLRLLEEKEVVPPTDRLDKLDPQRLKAGVACLKAQGYRSAELYMSAEGVAPRQVNSRCQYHDLGAFSSKPWSRASGTCSG